MSLQTVLAFTLTIILLISNSDAVKNCHSCARGQGACQSTKSVECTRETAAATVAVLVASTIYPNTSRHAPPSDQFQCVSVQYDALKPGVEIPSKPGDPQPTDDDYEVKMEVKGCIFQPSDQLCEDHLDVNGRFHCLHCTSDYCNASVTIQGSLTILIVSWILRHLFK